ncbi:hypothetical protein [Bradyrhizobium sp. USDA 3315]
MPAKKAKAKSRRKLPLSIGDRAIIRAKLSRENVETTFAGLRKFIGEARWIGASNRYGADTIQRIQSDNKIARVREPRQLSQYIAASTVLHCADGWSYLGRALMALLGGDSARAIHLAYYAELRAAMSLLATEGIGVFSNAHFFIDAPNSAKLMQTRSGTHNFVWDCLKYWGMQSRSGLLFSRLVRPYGRTLDDWLIPVGGSSSVAPQAQRWFLQWGMDLKVLSSDRDARNTSSYRPSGLLQQNPIEAEAVLSFVRETWAALEPSPLSSFEGIDRHILRIALERVFKGTTGKNPSEEPAKFGATVASVLKRQDLPVHLESGWAGFLKRQTVPDDLLLVKYSKEDPASALGHFAVTARATLMLRIASGAAAETVQAAGFTASDIAFWSSGLGRGRGLSDALDVDGAATELWADIEDHLRSVGEFQSEYTAADQTFSLAGTKIGQSLFGLGSCERVAIWSLTS